MCLAIYKPAGKNVPEDHLEEGFQSNRDGAGFAYVENGIVRYMKGFFDYKTFLENYKERVKDEYPAVIHFRWATVGEKNTENCHPFEAGNGGVLVHNGPQIQKLGNEKQSDSSEFAEKIIQPLTPDVILLARDVLEGYLGYNKVVLLYADQAIILNENAGHWENGIWYSNDGYRTWYTTGSWHNHRSSMTQRNPSVFDDLADEADGEEPREMFDMLTEEQTQAILDAIPTYMMGYIEKNIDITNHFYDVESKQWFFYDNNYDEYVHLETGYAIDEYYEEILERKFPYEVDEELEVVDAKDEGQPDGDEEDAEVTAILDTLGRAFQPTEDEPTPARLLN